MQKKQKTKKKGQWGEGGRRSEPQKSRDFRLIQRV